MSIREYESKDKSYVIELYREVFAEPPWNESWSYNDVAKNIENSLSRETPLFFVAETDGKIVGFIWGYKLLFQEFPFLKGLVGERTTYVAELGVEKKERRKGVGTSLTNKLLKEARKQSYEDVVLRTDVSGPAYNFYLALGFEDVGIRDSVHQERTYLKKSIK